MPRPVRSWQSTFSTRLTRRWLRRTAHLIQRTSACAMSTEPITSASGACLCGSVKYQVDGPLRPVVYCHCEQCRRTSGHYVSATACSPKHLTITAEDGLRWFRSSSHTRPAFCASCGSSLFWRPYHGEYVSIMAGTLDGPTGLKAVKHIFVPAVADYYSIHDGLPQHVDHGSVNLEPGSE